VNAFFVSTPDEARNVRAVLFPPPGLLRSVGIEVQQVASQALPPLRRTLLYQTGLAWVDGLEAVEWQPGALADHLLRTLKEQGLGRAKVEGLPHCDWVLIDAGDVIVHLFRPEVRSFYNIEKIWSVEPPARQIAI
jgi:hypothetical protein